MFRQLANKSSTGSGTFEVLDRPVQFSRFRLDKLVLKLMFGFASTPGGTLAAETFCENTKVSIYWRDGSLWLEDVPLRVLEWVAQVLRRGYADALVECVDKTISASATNEIETFYIDLPLAMPLFARPTDFSQAAAQIGRIVIKPGATGNANITVASAQCIVLGHGEEVDYFHAGARLHIGVQPSNVSKRQQLPVGGRLLVAGMYSLDNSGSPIAASGPTLFIDSTELVDVPDLTALQLQNQLGAVAQGVSFPARSSLTQTQWATLVQPEAGAEIGKLPVGDVLDVRFQSNTGTAQDQNFALVRVVPKTAAARRTFPGATKRSPDELASETQTAKLSSGDIIPQDIASYLPEKVYTPEAMGAAA